MKTMILLAAGLCCALAAAPASAQPHRGGPHPHWGWSHGHHYGWRHAPRHHGWGRPHHDRW